MKFLELTLESGKSTFVNMEKVYEMRNDALRDRKGATLYIFPGDDGDSVSVLESVEEILAKI